MGHNMKRLRLIIMTTALKGNQYSGPIKHCQLRGKKARFSFSKSKIMITVFCMLHHDDAWLHTLLVTLSTITHLGWMMTPHPAYSSDLEHLDFFFLAHWRDKILELDEKLLLKVKHLFKELDTTLFRSAFVSWQKCWTKSVDCDGG